MNETRKAQNAAIRYLDKAETALQDGKECADIFAEYTGRATITAAEFATNMIVAARCVLR